MTVRSVSDEC